VGVAVQTALGVAVLGLVAGKVPNDQGLVSAAGEKHVGAVVFTVSAGSLTSKLFSHGFGSYFSIDVAKLVTQPFCAQLLVSEFQTKAPSPLQSTRLRRELCDDSCWRRPRRRSSYNRNELAVKKATYVALQGALEDELLSHLDGPSWDSKIGGRMVS